MLASSMTSVRVGLETLRANPLRTVLSALGVVIGVAALVAVLALGDGMERFGREQIAQEGYHVVSIASNDVETVDGVRVARTGFPVFTTADAAELARTVPEGTQVVMQVMGGGLVRGPDGGRPRGSYVLGLLPSADHPALAIVHGRALTAAEAATDAPVALVSARLADSLVASGGAASLVGKVVTLGDDRPRTVVGILAPEPGRDNVTVIPVDGAAAAMGPAIATAGGQRTPTIELHAAGVEAVPAVRAAAERWAAGRWTDWQREVRVSSLGEGRLTQLAQSVLVFKLFMGAIVSISLVVGGIGIMNVLLASVTERTREIGIRKTTGARNRDILRQFLAESVVVSGAGSVIGAVLGLAAAFGFTAIIRAVTEAPVYADFTIRTLLVAALVAIAIGLIFGTYPARRAARLSPIDAIRHE
jgi:putative ABC transport system permease protein